MNQVAQKIKQIKLAKGYSQEELADRSKLNLRTIQRVENEETEPRGKTLQLICLALGTTTEELLQYGEKSDKSFMIYYHLAVLAGLAFPLGNLILPFILWVTKKDIIKNLKDDGKPLLNFQITWSIVMPILFVATASGRIFQNTLPENLPDSISIILRAVIYSAGINNILAVVFAYRISKGKTTFITYPSSIPFLR